MFDILIRNGRIADGTGNAWYKADIGIQGDKIAKIKKIDPREANRVIDAEGRVVSPGFFDLHTHDDFVFPTENNSEILSCKITQGITTCVGGNCGYSPFPLLDATADLMKGYCTFLTPDGVTWQWKNFAEYAAYLETHGIAVNTAHLVGHGAIRIAVMGFDSSNPNEEQMNSMRTLLAEALKQGAFGMTAGLVYPPGMWSRTEELINLAQVLRRHGGIYANHMRGHSETHLDAVRETIRVGEEAGIPVHIHHQGLFGKNHYWKIPVTIRMIDEAREVKGVDVTHDLFPYSGANTTILAMFPPWSLDGGVPKLVERLKDPATRKKILEYAQSYIAGWPPEWPWNPIASCGYDNILVIWCESEKNKRLEGKTLAEIGKLLGKDPFDAACDLAMEERGAVMCIYFGWMGSREEDWRSEYICAVSKHAVASFESDAILLGKGKPHPAAYGVMPRVLGHYVREMGLLTLEDAVRKMTSLPAMRLGIRDRGVISEGNYADIVVFNPRTVAERATYENPEQQSEGIDYVLINGSVVVDEGIHNKEVLAGKVIKSAAFTP